MTFLEMSDRVTFMTDGGWIGMGSLTEMNEAKEMGLEISMVTPYGITPIDKVRIVERGTDCWRRQLRVAVKP